MKSLRKRKVKRHNRFQLCQLQQAEIRLIYGIDENGEQVASYTYTADGVIDSVPDYFTGLTLFEAGKIDFLRRHGRIVAREDI